MSRDPASAVDLYEVLQISRNADPDATPGLRGIGARLRVPLGDGVSGWVAANRSTIYQAEPARDAPDLLEPFAFTSCVSVPVFVGADLFGVITGYWTTPIRPGAVHAIGVLAQEVGLLVANERSRAPHRFEWTPARPSAIS